VQPVEYLHSRTSFARRMEGAAPPLKRVWFLNNTTNL